MEAKHFLTRVVIFCTNSVYPMQSEGNSNFYQILVHEMNWKRLLRFGGGEWGCLLFEIMICLAAFWYCVYEMPASFPVFFDYVD